MRKCGKCGARNDAQAIVCSLCNERLGGAHEATSYEPRMFERGRGQTFRGKAPAGDPNATRDEPPPASALAHTLPEANPNAAKHFLVPTFGEPARLDSAKTLVFGRDDDCDFALASAKISRRHAEILFSKADKAYVRDLGSQNGTFVNNDKVTGERALEDGDELRLGDFAVTYRKLAPGADEAVLKMKPNETAVMEAVKVEASDDGALIGDISILPISEVLRRLGSLRAHGNLAIDLNGMRGDITLADGKPTAGSYAGLEGAPAITAMASLTKGHFSFTPDPNAPKPAPAPVAPAPQAAPAPTARPASARQPVAPGGHAPTPGPNPARPAPAPGGPAPTGRRPMPPGQS